MPGKLAITGNIDTPRDPQSVRAYCEGRQAAKSALSAPTFGTADTGAVGPNNAMTFTAKRAGQGITVSIANPAKQDNPLSVSLRGLEVFVSLKTGATGTVESTAGQVIAAINAHPQAGALIGAANTGASTGAGVVTTVATPIPLAGSNVVLQAQAAVDAYVAGYTSWGAAGANIQDVCAIPYAGG